MTALEIVFGKNYLTVPVLRRIRPVLSLVPKPFLVMTPMPDVSPSCVRSLEAQLLAPAILGKSIKPQTNQDSSVSRVDSPKAHPRADQQGVSIPAVRSLIFRLSAVTGSLSSLFLSSVPLDGTDQFTANAAIAATMAHLLKALTELSCSLSINLHSACCKKIDLNGRKYPVELCKVCQMMSTQT